MERRINWKKICTNIWSNIMSKNCRGSIDSRIDNSSMVINNTSIGNGSMNINRTTIIRNF